jgi:RHS repeat-associated protein
MPLVAKEEMLSPLSDPCVLFPLAAFDDLAENSRQGFTRNNVAPHQGSVWSNSANALEIREVLLENRGGSRCTGKERDSESGLDNFGARYNSSNMGRFMSPDPFGGHQQDPQSLNKYSYVRNNPLNLTDPSGLDFYLSCLQASLTCQKDAAGNLVHGTTTTSTANGNTTSTFTPTVVTSASLNDPNSGNSAAVNQNGVQITTTNADGTLSTAEGIFINNTPSANGIQGSGDLTGFTFDINHSDEGTGNLAGGNFHFAGSPEDAERLLRSRGAFNELLDPLDGTLLGFHPYTDQFRFGSGPVSHLSVPMKFIAGPDEYNPAGVMNPNYTTPTTGGYHVDAHKGGAHAKDVIKSILDKF